MNERESAAVRHFAHRTHRVGEEREKERRERGQHGLAAQQRGEVGQLPAELQAQPPGARLQQLRHELGEFLRGRSRE